MHQPPSVPYPGPTPAYGQPVYQQIPAYGDVKDPFANDRFKPKKKLNDPIFLILFILQVGPFSFLFIHLTAAACWIRRSVRNSAQVMDLRWWTGRGTRQAGSKDRQSNHPQLVRAAIHRKTR